MKVIPTLFLGLLFLLRASCLLGGPSVVTGTFLNHRNAPKAYIYQAYGADFFVMDSTALSKGEFVFKFQDLPRGFYRLGISREISIVLVLGEERIQVKADLDDPESAVIQGSDENRILDQYRRVNLEVYNQKYQAEQIVKSGYRGGDFNDYANLVQNLKRKFDSLDDYRNQSYRQLADQYPNLFIGKICRFLTYDEPASYMAYDQFSDPQLWRGDMIQAKTLIYFQRLIPRNINQWKSSALQLLRNLPEGSNERELVYGAIITLYAASAPEYAKRMAAVYFDEYPDSRYHRTVKAVLPQGPPGIGDEAPEIELNQVEGQPLTLSSLRGKVVLVDFWASWCAPCRVENPNLVKAFKKYKDKDFTILSVSLDHNRQNWLRAIEKDKLTWFHVSDLKGWHSSAAKLYRIRAIPTSYLVDANGIIIAQNLRGEKLTSTLDRILD